MFLKYVKANLIPLIIEILFIISYYIFPKDDFIYVNAFFYVLLFVYFLISKDLNLKEWFLSFRSGKKYWIQVLLTFLGFMLAFILTTILEGIFPGLETGTINLRRDTWLTLGVFAISTILFPAITEETFYRKNLILFDSKKTVIITTILSMFLYACEHSLAPWGIFLTMIWALPLSLSYIKTRNIYVVMTAHFLGNLLGNGVDVILTLIHWL
ncbi:type II CAAX endopeptidase family protein [Streptococcus equinus]|uniref:type II CAAX endopeptidase family protein n=1 Tax=Streptococcus equinus TaxID=1335 RepID=UPI00038B5201|nr:type II CAAX endopeptidase family protein [Streptococcus equinus]EQC69717.1 CAAn amino terminal protease family protein [Streptococcus sp. HSISB1]KEY48169.1 CAAX protease [Streptococcus equinus]GEB11229.1 CAAX amino protease [Streptococcus equinus]